MCFWLYLRPTSWDKQKMIETFKEINIVWIMKEVAFWIMSKDLYPFSWFSRKDSSEFTAAPQTGIFLPAVDEKEYSSDNSSHRLCPRSWIREFCGLLQVWALGEWTSINPADLDLAAAGPAAFMYSSIQIMHIVSAIITLHCVLRTWSTLYPLAVHHLQASCNVICVLKRAVWMVKWNRMILGASFVNVSLSL